MRKTVFALVALGAALFWSLAAMAAPPQASMPDTPALSDAFLQPQAAPATAQVLPQFEIRRQSEGLPIDIALTTGSDSVTAIPPAMTMASTNTHPAGTFDPIDPGRHAN